MENYFISSDQYIFDDAMHIQGDKIWCRLNKWKEKELLFFIVYKNFEGVRENICGLLQPLNFVSYNPMPINW